MDRITKERLKNKAWSIMMFTVMTLFGGCLVYLDYYTFAAKHPDAPFWTWLFKS